MPATLLEELDTLCNSSTEATTHEKRIAKLLSSEKGLEKVAAELDVSYTGFSQYASQSKTATRKLRRPKREYEIRPDLKERVTNWLQHCKRRFAKETVHTYGHAIREFAHFLTKEHLQITASTINKFLDFVLDTRTKKSANLYLAAIKSFCRWSFNSDSPAASIKALKAEPPEQRYLTPKEYQAVLLATKKPIEKDVIQFFGNTGLRRQEFMDLKPANIDNENKRLIIIGKGGKRRIIPINNIVQQILKKYPDFEFVKAYQTPGRLNSLCAVLARRAHIPRFGPHAIRHFFATRLINSGVSIIKVSRILGHSSVAVTEQIYCHMVPQDFDGITNCLTS